LLQHEENRIRCFRIIRCPWSTPTSISQASSAAPSPEDP